MQQIEKILDSQASKFNFMKGLVCIARADGSISEEEMFFFSSAAQQLGIVGENLSLLQMDMDSCTSVSQENVKFNATKQAVFFVREALQLCYVDGGYSENERDVLNKIASSNKVSPELVESMEEWVKKGVEWKQAGDSFLEMEG